MCEFYLGTHHPHWLRLSSQPLFVSRRTLSRTKKPHAATCAWALDSGGFSELSMFGEWRTSPEQYANEVTRWQSVIGNLKFAAIQDWMCEPFITEKTKRTVEDHQRSTVASLQTLRSLAPDAPWLPVIQGFKIKDYFDCVRLYEREGIDLKAFETVGVGSVCRRQKGDEAAEIIRELSRLGLNLHGFGLKLQGLKKAAPYLKSADSMAWSYAARNTKPLEGCTHKSCANCQKFAEIWRLKALRSIDNCSTQQFMDFAE